MTKQTRGTGWWWEVAEFFLWLHYVIADKLSDVTYVLDAKVRGWRIAARITYYNH